MNNLTIRQTEAQAPEPLPSKVDFALTSMGSAIITIGPKSTIPAARAPAPEQRAYLADRVTTLDVWLSPAGPDLAEIEIAAIFDCMAMRSGEETDLRAKLGIYTADLCDLPRFALSAACRDFRIGIVGDGKWVPTQGEIRRRTVFHADPHISERGRIRRVLDAKLEYPPQISEERRKATADLIRKAHGIPERGLTRGAPAHIQRPPMPPDGKQKSEAELREEWLEREKANPHCPAPSEFLRAQLGLHEPKQDSEAA